MSTRLRNYDKKRIMNKSKMSKLKTCIKKFKNGEITDFSSVDKMIQTMKSQGIIHKNKASRLQSRLWRSQCAK